jgi:hypothetical protein
LVIHVPLDCYRTRQDGAKRDRNRGKPVIYHELEKVRKEFALHFFS